ncbi:FG-GAP-like repeat-containing protein [Knoellia sp. p5-6-4]|uniref:FG-GAP-like repeat-containing protein n=1 Tax=unclassified Knoellia TaxID=2618719 RepID=UPI0023DBB400|nr:FG-GAP-like repeat-containing protein [Knoellia sp. p5-6-4]MDF2146479.1 FG-GAP-like repeat-containing protein [Knoellia sp. p5-6-4]
MTTTPGPARLVLTALVATSLAAGTTSVAEATASTSYRDGMDLKTRAINALLDGSTTDHSAPKPAPAPVARNLAGSATAGPSAGDGTTPAQPQAAGDLGDCTGLALDWTPTHDRVWLHWNDMARDNYTILARRDGGSWRQLGSTTETSFMDASSNTHGFVTYRLDSDELICSLGDWVTMVTPNGRGEVDAVYGATASGTGTPGLMEQDAYSYAMPVGRAGVDPAFSPDGRFVASTRQDAAGVWQLSVNAAGSTRRSVRSLAMPAGFVGAEAAWSPDGSEIVYTRYALDAQGAATDPELHVLTVATGADRVVAGSQGLVQSDWRSRAQLVAAGFAPGTGLYNLPAAGGAATEITGTANAGDPEVAPDGRVWFVEGNGTTFTVRTLTGDLARTVHTSTTHWFEQPRVAQDGTVYILDVDMHDVGNPDDNTFTVTRGTFGADGMQQTGIGAPRDARVVGFHGFDVRQPLSTGTSDFVGDANPDVLARDNSGRQWVYPMTQDLSSGAPRLGTRVQVGTGWNIYNAIVAAGDLTGDGRGDIVTRDTSGVLWRYDGLGGGRVSARVRIGTSWSGYLIVGTGDFNGDSRADLLARDKYGVLWLYPGTGRGGLTTRTKLGTGWQGMTAILGSGDFDYDNDADVLARDGSGVLWLYPNSGRGSFQPRRKVGSGWGGFSALLAPESVGSLLNVLGRDRYGNLVAYGVIGDGRFESNLSGRIGTGWSGYAMTS